MDIARHRALILVALFLGCTNKALEQRVEGMESQMKTLLQSAQAQRQRVENIENRVLLLQDEIETLKLAKQTMRQESVSVPDLPTVKIAPPQGKKTNAQQTVGDEEDVESEDNSEAPEKLTFGEQVYQEIDDEGNIVQNKKTAVPKKEALKQKQKGEDAILAEYQRAYALYEQGRLAEAREAFREFARKYPKHSYADNALYWVAECYYDEKDYETARKEFIRVTKEYRDGNKAPDAMVKIALCEKALGRISDAKKVLNTVLLTYPETEAARVAERLLQELE
jgi:tol-pal system protein YbgF